MAMNSHNTSPQMVVFAHSKPPLNRRNDSETQTWQMLDDIPPHQYHESSPIVGFPICLLGRLACHFHVGTYGLLPIGGYMHNSQAVWFSKSHRSELNTLTNNSHRPLIFFPDEDSEGWYSENVLYLVARPSGIGNYLATTNISIYPVSSLIGTLAIYNQQSSFDPSL
ncbi:hypothetical protein ABKN59_007181 [Abortiporus biennis]